MSATLRQPAERAQRVLAGAWFGLLLCVALVAAPAAFQVLERPGPYVARLFAVEAPISLLAASALLLLERWRQRGLGLPASPNGVILLALLALMCTVAGYYALQPLMAQARSGGASALSFGQLHALSLGLYGVKTMAAGVLAWRVAGR